MLEKRYLTPFTLTPFTREKVPDTIYPDTIYLDDGILTIDQGQQFLEIN